MSSICLYFQVHQPRRIKRFKHFNIGDNQYYFDDASDGNLNNKKLINKVSKKCYLPTNKVLLSLLQNHPEFKFAFSFSGLVLEQFEEYVPKTLRSFQELVKTGRVEVLSETYYHSLSFLHSRNEFLSQIKLHDQKIKDLFGITPKVFRNTELIYNNSLARFIEKLGYIGILAEGADHVLDWRSPNFVYSPYGTKKISLLLKNYRLSDDIAFRFSDSTWKHHPLTVEKFANWVNAINGNGEVINLFMDYETFGEHQWAATGIFDFLSLLPGELLKHPDNDFVTPSEAIKRYKPVAKLNIPQFISWADIERDLSAWLSNEMQRDAISQLFKLEKPIHASKNQELLKAWRSLTTSDHFYYMCTKWFADGDVHKYFNPYDSPYDAFRYYMNVLADMKYRLKQHKVIENSKLKIKN